MEKQVNVEQGILPGNSFEDVENFKSEIKKLSDGELSHISQKLKFLCDDVDPYQCDFLSVEAENILNEFGLKQSLADPFIFTKRMLQLMDFTETEMKKRIQ